MERNAHANWLRIAVVMSNGDVFVNHVLLNTGEERQEFLDSFGADIVAKIFGTLWTGDVTLPREFHLSSIDISPGWGAYVITKNVPVAMCYGCWNSADSERAWKAAERIYLDATERDVTLDVGWNLPEMPEVPWLASVDLHGLHRLSAADQIAAGTLQTAVFFAMLAGMTKMPEPEK